MNVRIHQTFQHVTWMIRDFLELPQENEFLDSPEFFFHDDRYGIRLYPQLNKNETSFHVRRLSGNFPKNKVSCRIGLRMRESNGDECNEYYPYALDENCSYSRSTIEEGRDEFVPDGILTVVCRMRLNNKDSRAGRSVQRKEEQRGFPGRNASFSSRRSPAKMELTTESPCRLVELTVRNVFELLSETGDSLNSPEFRFAGDNYCFRIEANGDTEDTELLLVRLTSTFTEHAVYYRIGYDDKDCPTYSNSLRSLVSSTGLCISRSKLEEESKKYVCEGVLDLVLFLRLGEQSSPGFETSDAAQKRTGLRGQLQSDYRKVLQEGTFSDACLVVRGKEFKVHRVVLCARSTVFAAMFTHDTAEKESGRVVVDDLDPDSFGDFLEYLYTGDIQEKLSDENAFGLYTAADKYDVSTLKSECVEHMQRTLSVDSFSDVVTLALRHREEDLLQNAITFFKDNLHLIFISEKWQQLVIENGASVNEFLSKAYSPGTQ